MTNELKKLGVHVYHGPILKWSESDDGAIRSVFVKVSGEVCVACVFPDFFVDLRAAIDGGGMPPLSLCAQEDSRH